MNDFADHSDAWNEWVDPKHPQHTSHLILIGAPPFMIPPTEQEAFWKSDASHARKLG